MQAISIALQVNDYLKGWAQKDGKIKCLTTGRTFPSEEGKPDACQAATFNFYWASRHFMYIVKTASGI